MAQRHPTAFQTKKEDIRAEKDGSDVLITVTINKSFNKKAAKRVIKEYAIKG
jgi:hypothetical protein